MPGRFADRDTICVAEAQRNDFDVGGHHSSSSVSLEPDVRDREWLGHIVEWLQRLFVASVKTGNPVVW